MRAIPIASERKDAKMTARSEKARSRDVRVEMRIAEEI